ncbi:SLC13 family permease [Vibrio salinus]|uniref:SLC13 family permease n=1 Tax=Vibrio salinus TaxID=2899784 RepID=UPI001E296E88|nr:SLC13 family permease [Vibrio salinus]MCE0493793.1 SLC13 family permease [Vibrio salinus]
MHFFIGNSALTIIIFCLTILALIKFQNTPHIVFGVSLLVLITTKLVSTQQVLDSFSNIGLLTLIMLMTCSLALEKTTLLRRIARKIITPSYHSTWLRLYIFTSITSAFLNNTAVVSTLLAPIRNNIHHPASKLLIPLSYAAILGGTLTLVGTSTNLIVNSMVIDMGLPPLEFFDFTLIGSIILILGGITLYFLSKYLPTIAEDKKLATDYFIDMTVMPTSKLIDRSVEGNGLRNLEELFLVEIIRDNRLISPVSPNTIVRSNDRLIFSGDITKIQRLSEFDGLISFAGESGLPMDNLTEVLIRPESILVGQTLKESGFRALFDSAVLGIKRDGEKLSGKLGQIELKAGDYLILATGEDFNTRRNINKNFYLISGAVETEQVLSGFREMISVWGFLFVIMLAACKLIPLFNGLLILLAVLIFTGCLSANEIMQRLPRNIWLIIASALLMSNALQNSGALNSMNEWLLTNSCSFSPFIGLITIYFITWLMTELMTNNAAAALIFPVAYGLSTSLNIAPEPYILAVAFGASASFISPYGYQTNLMVYSAGNYCLNDFMRIGLPISIVYGSIVITMLGLFYL